MTNLYEKLCVKNRMFYLCQLISYVNYVLTETYNEEFYYNQILKRILNFKLTKMFASAKSLSAFGKCNTFQANNANTYVICDFFNNDSLQNN